MNEEIGLKHMVRMSKFADMHSITWPAVDYLIRTDKVDHRVYKGKKYIILTEKTKKYQPNKKK